MEAALRRHPSVEQAAVVLQSQGSHGQRLVAYVAPRPGEQLPPASLQTLLASWLPAHLVPCMCVVLERLPVTANGKLDRTALAPPNGAADDGGTLAEPRDATERALMELWADVLNLSPVGIHDNFFDLGGHSLTVMRLVSRVRERFGVDLPIASVFEALTVEQFALKLKAQPRLAGPQRISRRLGAGPWPLSFGQERLWFLDQLSPGTANYNLPLSFICTDA